MNPSRKYSFNIKSKPKPCKELMYLPNGSFLSYEHLYIPFSEAIRLGLTKQEGFGCGRPFYYLVPAKQRGVFTKLGNLFYL